MVMLFMNRVARLGRFGLSKLREEARATERDFYSLVVSRVLEIDYYDVLKSERDMVKTILFATAYHAPPEVLFESLRRGK